MTITQTADTLVIEQMATGRTPVPIRLTYRLDGTDTRQTVNHAEIVTRVTWEGDRLVTTVTGPSADWKDVWSLEGDRLTIVTTTPGRTLTVTRTYRKN